MRDFVIVAIVFGSIPLVLLRPQLGVLLWYWISLMNPHRLTWGYAYNLRVALVAAVVTVIAWLFSREKKSPPNSIVTYLLAALTLWVSISTLFALVPDAAEAKWEEVIKILGMTFVAMALINTKERIIQLVWVVAFSLGFYGIKGGLFVIASGGSYRVWGPDSSFIADNNALGLALIMVIPLFHFLSGQVQNRWLRLGLLVAIGPIIAAVFGTYSRGDFVALGITIAAFWLRARRRLLSGVFLVGFAETALALLPAAWYDRMSSIDNYAQDESLQGRVNSWYFAWRLAEDRPLTGGGFDVVDDTSLYFKYVPGASEVHNFHSIYFQFLGEHGFPGLLIFLGLILSSLMTANSIMRMARHRPDLQWARDLAAGIQISIVGYCAAGTFLNLGFYDLFYVLVAILVCTKTLVAKEVAAAARPGIRSMAEGAPRLGAVFPGHGAPQSPLPIRD